jgi:TetR/AcrR family transcriptional regulator, transcriptional repressor for nem operon
VPPADTDLSGIAQLRARTGSGQRFWVMPLTGQRCPVILRPMPRPSLKEQIVVAALETLHRKGFNATSVQDITDAAEAPKGSFYNHFGSKEDLAVEALDRYWQRILGSLKSLSDEKVPPLPRLRAYFSRLSRIASAADYSSGCFVGNMSVEMSNQSRMVRERLALILAAWTRAITSCVREAQADGSVRQDADAKIIAEFLLNSWEGAVLRSKVDKDAVPLDTFEKVTFDLLLK